MKNRNKIYHILLSGIVLFSILFQSIHSYHHNTEKISEKICIHEHNEDKASLTHAHSHFENCFVCQFSFSPFNTTESQLLQSTIIELSSVFSVFSTKEITILFKGSLFALRGPPKV